MPTSDSTHILPLCFLTNSLQRIKPSSAPISFTISRSDSDEISIEEFK